MNTITKEQQDAISEKIVGMHLPSGLGDEHNACSIAAINLALSGRLIDDVPDCMSEVIGRWIIDAQDGMPDEMRNSPEWRALLPLAAGTGREHEDTRLAIILDWMWGVVLPSLQPSADLNGFGAPWRAMCEQRTEAAASAASAASAVWAARAAWAASAAWDARAAASAASAAARAAAWQTYNPIGLLRKLIAVTEEIK